jgi:uncharacterized membrane protein YtjA (UPF0391 family)
MGFEMVNELRKLSIPRTKIFGIIGLLQSPYIIHSLFMNDILTRDNVLRAHSLLHQLIREGLQLMLRAAILFFVIGLIAMALGMGNVAGISLEVGKDLLYVFLALAVISFLISLVGGRRSGPPLP